MLAGRKLLETLIVYYKIDVQAELNEIRMKHSKRKDQSMIEEEK